MKSDFLHGPAPGFILRFAVIFGLLIAPWPGWNAAYARYFQGFGQMMFGSSGDNPRRITFGPASPKDTDLGLDTRIILENTRPPSADEGKRLLRANDIPSRSIGWVPTALTIALVLATPIPWRRRLLALVGGLLLIHLFICFTLQSWVWLNSTGVALLNLSAFWQRVAEELNYALMNQLGVSFTVPVLIWTLVTFRRQDQDALAN